MAFGILLKTIGFQPFAYQSDATLPVFTKDRLTAAEQLGSKKRLKYRLRFAGPTQKQTWPLQPHRSAPRAKPASPFPPAHAPWIAPSGLNPFAEPSNRRLVDHRPPELPLANPVVRRRAIGTRNAAAFIARGCFTGRLPFWLSTTAPSQPRHRQSLPCTINSDEPESALSRSAGATRAPDARDCYCQSISG